MSKDGSLLMLALDWARAFDCISPNALIVALRRFGLPELIVDLVASIYIQRKFKVRDSGEMSEFHPQEAG
eukprot:10392976-Karenia_brevis.AAC.1